LSKDNKIALDFSVAPVILAAAKGDQMKNYFLFTFVLAAVLLVSTAQATLTLNSTGTVNYTFDSYDGAAAPADWTISSGGGSLVFRNYDRGTGTSQGIRAYTNNLSSANRAFGFLGAASGVTNFFADLTVSNNTGMTLTSLTLSFDALQYRVSNNDRVSSITFTNLSGLGLASQTYLAVTNLTTGAQDPPLSLGTYNQTLAGLNIANGGTFTFRWIYNSGLASGNAQGLALDNVKLTVIPEPSTFVLVALALVPLMLRRRR
jgi:hypothetical protein